MGRIRSSDVLKLEGVLSFLNENVYSFLSHSPTLWLKRGIPPEVKTPEVPNSSRFAASKVSALQVGIVGNGEEFLSYRNPYFILAYFIPLKEGKHIKKEGMKYLVLHR